MKGYRMVLLVNAGIFAFVALSAVLYANVMRHDADTCRATPSEDVARCDALAATADTTRRVAPAIFGVGLLLFVLGMLLGRGGDTKAPPGGL